jgi:hypothetical protein
MDETSTATEGPSRTFAPLLHLSSSSEFVPTTTLAVGPGPGREPDDSPAEAAPPPHAAPAGQAGAGRTCVTQSPPGTPHALDTASDGVEITRLPWGYAVTITTKSP